MYAAIGTRPDIAYAVSALSKYSAAPRLTHMEAAERVLRYLAATADLGLVLGGGPNLKLQGYSDSNWAKDEDDSRSTSGYLFKIGPSPVTWSTRTQQLPAGSSMEAKYIGLAFTVCKALWLHSLLFELGFPC